MMGNAIKTVEKVVNAASNENTLCIISDTHDRLHNGDVDTVLEELALLHKKVLETLPELPDVFFRSDEYSALANSYRYSMYVHRCFLFQNQTCGLVYLHLC